jgi:penicillin-binding protein 1A
MPKRNPPETSRRRNDAPATASRRGPGAGSLLLFWPFHLFHFVTRPVRQPLRFLLRVCGYPVVAGLYALLFFAVIYGIRAQQYNLAQIHAMPQRSIIRDRLGEEIGRIHGEKRSIVPLRHVSENFRKAILAREDERFYNHGAFDTIGIVRAAMKNAQGKREGASTITQQLVSDVFKLKRGEKRGDIPRQLDRKLLEIAIAIRLEFALEKDEILEAYINQINWGLQINGIGEAARIYFEKHPSELTLSQSALLAGIVRGPDSFNPFKSIEAATRERNTTLDRMLTAGVITRAEADAAKQEPIEVRPKDRREIRASYAMDTIREELEIILGRENIELGGLEIITTIDLRIQQKAEEALEKKLREVERLPGYAHPTRDAWNKLPEAGRGDPPYIQGATVVVENRSGAVLAIVGGRDARESYLNRAKHNKNETYRQLGSIFKPFVYMAAFDQGLRPESPVSDGPIQPGEIAGGRNWRPHNSDGTYGGMQPASYGLIRSRNTMSVRIGNHAGIPKVAETAVMAGFSTPMPNTPTAFLGSWGSLPWEVATAYTIFPNDGVRYRPYLISEIKDRDGNVLHSTQPLSYQAAKSGSAWSVSRILTEVTERGTAASVRRLGFEKPCGGKTGTSNDFKDAWFAGYTSSLSCAVWVGFDKPKTTINRGFGSVLALPVWVDIMKTADRLGYKAGELHSKVNLVTIDLCRLNGKRATAGCRSAGTAESTQVPGDIAPPETDFCPIHPARAQTVVLSETVDTPPKALPVETPPQAPQPLRALPVNDPPLKAVPVDESER